MAFKEGLLKSIVDIDCLTVIWGFPEMGAPQIDGPTKMDDWGVPYFRKPPFITMNVYGDYVQRQ